MKKFILVISVVLIFASLFAAGSSAESTVVDSMEFQGTAVELSFNDALSIMLKDNASVKIEQLNVDQAKVNSSKETKKARSLSELIRSGTDDSVTVEKIMILQNLIVSISRQMLRGIMIVP